MEKSEATGHIPSGLFIIGVDNNDNVEGFIASWVQQVSFKPLIVAIAMNPHRKGFKFIEDGGVFTINTVGDHDKSYLKDFWSGYKGEENPFKKLKLETSKDGGVLLKQAKSSMVCKKISISQPGDHAVVFAEVLDGVVHSQEAKSMTHIRKTAEDY